jgi:hypothetical protein
MTAPHAIARAPAPVTDTVLDRADAGVRMRLAVSGWRIVWRRQPDGRTVIEVRDETGDLTGLIAGTRLPILSADAGWRGVTRGGGGGRRCWALAIGQRPREPAGPPSPSRAGGRAAAARAVPRCALTPGAGCGWPLSLAGTRQSAAS